MVGIVETPINWKQTADDALVRYRQKAERYGLVLDVALMMRCFEGINEGHLIISWERIYFMVLEAMDSLEEKARRQEFEPMGTEQHYGDLEYKKILDQCVCAGCWSDLTVRKIPDGWEVYCLACGTDRGLHSQYHKKRMKHHDAEWAALATSRLEGWMVLNE